jgi:hypothetical protein
MESTGCVSASPDRTLLLAIAYGLFLGWEDSVVCMMDDMRSRDVLDIQCSSISVFFATR